MFIQTVTFFILLSAVLVNTSLAKTFVVNSGYDVNDLTPGNGLCVAYLIVNPPFVLPFCTLRAAIEEANALPGEDIIILGSGTYSLSLSGMNEDQTATGDLDITDSLQIIGAGANSTFVDAKGLDRVFDIFGTNISVTLSNITIKNGILPAGQATVHQGGGGVRNASKLSVKNVVISNNSVFGRAEGDGGGGLFNKGHCSVVNSTLKNNYANNGGGILNFPHGTLNVSLSTIQANRSQNGAGLTNRGSGSLVNTTISNNSAQGDLASTGGAVFNRGQLQVVQCTIAENSADQGGGIRNDGGTLSMVNTLVAGNFGKNCYSSGTIISEGYNLDSDNSCGLTSLDLKNVDPRLGTLSDNGGTTDTHGLYPGSVAIDTGKTLAAVLTDQRGVARPQRSAFDIGAVEALNFSIVPLLETLLLKGPDL